MAAARPALERAIPRLKDAGMEVSLFVSPQPESIMLAARLGATIVELHTGAYTQAAGAAQAEELRRLVAAARQAHDLGLRVNAGHGLDCGNVGSVAKLPHVEELNIGYSIICRAIFMGLEPAVREMAAAIRAAEASA